MTIRMRWRLKKKTAENWRIEVEKEVVMSYYLHY